MSYSEEQLRNLISTSEGELPEGTDSNLLLAVAKTESAFNPFAESKAGAKGLFQIMPFHYERLGISNPFEPKQSLVGGSKILAEELARYDGDTNLALAAYNAGPGAVDRAIKKANGSRVWDDIEPYLPKETQGYVRTVSSNYAQFKNSDVIKAPASSEPEVTYGTLEEFSAKAKQILEGTEAAGGEFLDAVSGLQSLYDSKLWPDTVKDKLKTGLSAGFNELSDKYKPDLSSAPILQPYLEKLTSDDNSQLKALEEQAKSEFYADADRERWPVQAWSPLFDKAFADKRAQEEARNNRRDRGIFGEAWEKFKYAGKSWIGLSGETIGSSVEVASAIARDWGIPAPREVAAKEFRAAMTPSEEWMDSSITYELDSKGNYKLDKNGNRIPTRVFSIGGYDLDLFGYSPSWTTKSALDLGGFIGGEALIALVTGGGSVFARGAETIAAKAPGLLSKISGVIGKTVRAEEGLRHAMMDVSMTAGMARDMAESAGADRDQQALVGLASLPLSLTSTMLGRYAAPGLSRLASDADKIAALKHTTDALVAKKIIAGETLKQALVKGAVGATAGATMVGGSQAVAAVGAGAEIEPEAIAHAAGLFGGLGLLHGISGLAYADAEGQKIAGYNRTVEALKQLEISKLTPKAPSEKLALPSPKEVPGPRIATVEEHRALVDQLNDFDRGPSNSQLVISSKLENYHPETLSFLQKKYDFTEDGIGNIVVLKRKSFQPGTSMELPDINAEIEGLQKSIAADSTDPKSDYLKFEEYSKLAEASMEAATREQGVDTLTIRSRIKEKQSQSKELRGRIADIDSRLPKIKSKAEREVLQAERESIMNQSKWLEVFNPEEVSKTIAEYEATAGRKLTDRETALFLDDAIESQKSEASRGLELEAQATEFSNLAVESLDSFYRATHPERLANLKAKQERLADLLKLREEKTTQAENLRNAEAWTASALSVPTEWGQRYVIESQGKWYAVDEQGRPVRGGMEHVLDATEIARKAPPLAHLKEISPKDIAESKQRAKSKKAGKVGERKGKSKKVAPPSQDPTLTPQIAPPVQPGVMASIGPREPLRAEDSNLVEVDLSDGNVKLSNLSDFEKVSRKISRAISKATGSHAGNLSYGGLMPKAGNLSTEGYWDLGRSYGKIAKHYDFVTSTHEIFHSLGRNLVGKWDQSTGTLSFENLPKEVQEGLRNMATTYYPAEALNEFNIYAEGLSVFGEQLASGGKVDRRVLDWFNTDFATNNQITYRAINDYLKLGAAYRSLSAEDRIHLFASAPIGGNKLNQVINTFTTFVNNAIADPKGLLLKFKQNFITQFAYLEDYTNIQKSSLSTAEATRPLKLAADYMGSGSAQAHQMFHKTGVFDIVSGELTPGAIPLAKVFEPFKGDPERAKLLNSAITAYSAIPYLRKGLEPGISTEDIAEVMRQVDADVSVSASEGKPSVRDGVERFFNTVHDIYAEVSNASRAGRARMERLIEAHRALGLPDHGYYVPWLREGKDRTVNSLRARTGSSRRIAPILSVLEESVAKEIDAAHMTRLIETIADQASNPMSQAGDYIREVTDFDTKKRIEDARKLEAAELITAAREQVGELSPAQETELLRVSMFDPTVSSAKAADGYRFISVLGADGAPKYYEVSTSLWENIKHPILTLATSPAVRYIFAPLMAASKLATTTLNLAFQSTQMIKDASGMIQRGNYVTGIEYAKFFAEANAAVFFGKENNARRLLDTMHRLGSLQMIQSREALQPREAGSLAPLVNIASHSFSGLFDILSKVEESTRLVAARTQAARLGITDFNKPLSEDQLLSIVYAAKYSTAGFHDRGMISRVINNFIPFFTARIAEVREDVVAAKARPYRMLTIAASGIATGIFHNLMNKDEDWYKSMQVFDNNFKIKWGNALLALPLTSTFGRFFAIGQGLGALINQYRDPEGADPLTSPSMKEAVKAAVKDMLPVTVNDFSPTGITVGIASSLPLFGALLQASEAVNKDMFTGRDVVPQDVANRAREMGDLSLEYNDKTLRIFKELGQITGTSPMRSEFILKKTLPAAHKYLSTFEEVVFKNKTPGEAIGALLSSRLFIPEDRWLGAPRTVEAAYAVRDMFSSSLRKQEEKIAVENETPEQASLRSKQARVRKEIEKNVKAAEDLGRTLTLDAYLDSPMPEEQRLQMRRDRRKFYENVINIARGRTVDSPMSTSEIKSLSRSNKKQKEEAQVRTLGEYRSSENYRTVWEQLEDTLAQQ